PASGARCGPGVRAAPMMVVRDQLDEFDGGGGEAVPDISIVISTRNRAPQLARCLQHVSMIRGRTPWELVVVNNGSTDDTADVLSEFSRNAPFPVRIVDEPLAGLSFGRNAGLRVARGEVVVFTDDDCYVRPDFVEQYRQIFDNQALGFAGGRILLHDRTDYPVTMIESESEQRFAMGGPVPCGISQGANMAVRRRALDAAGGFDVRLGSGTDFLAEDWDIQTRIAALGWVGGYFPGPTVSHHHGRKRRNAWKLIRGYNMGSGAVSLKLLADPRTRRIYLPHVLRRMLGDMKYHQLKIVQQIYGAVLFLRRNRGRLLEVPAADSNFSEIRPWVRRRR
ncbi:MAG: glycosyltransferase, partial [Terriglobia bacterium]